MPNGVNYCYMNLRNLLVLVAFCAMSISSQAQNLNQFTSVNENLLTASNGFQSSILTTVYLATPIISVNGAVPAAGQKAESCLQNNSFAFSANNISGSVSYVWDFGDGATSTSATPTHSYSTAGIYKVNLIVTDGVTTTTADQFVSVSPKPTVSFNTYGGAGNGNAYSFQSSSTIAAGSIASYIWSFGDGTGDIISNPTKIYATAGTYSVKLIVVSDKGCKDSVTQSVTITQTGTVLNAGFTVNSASQCLTGNNFIFTNTSNNCNVETQAWNFGDGSAINTNFNPSYSYTTAGDYTVTLTVTKGANSSVSVKLISVAPQPVVDFTATVTDNVVSFLPAATITSGSIASYQWNFGNTITSTLQSPTHTYASANTFNVTLIVTSANSCTAQISKNIITTMPVVSVPVVVDTAAFTASNAMCLKNNSYTFTNSSIIHGLNATYSWNFGDNTVTESTTNAVHAFAVAGTYYVQLTITSSLGVAVTNMPVVVYPQPIPLFNITNVGTAYTFINTSTIASGSIAALNWVSADGSLYTTNQYSQTFAPGIYSVKLTASSDKGCSEEITKNFTSVAPTTASFSVSGTALTTCYSNSNSFTFTNTSTTGASYYWEFGDGITSSLFSPVHNYTTTGSYIVRLRVTIGTDIVYATPVTINLNPKPSPEFILYLDTRLTDISSVLKRCFVPGMDFSFISTSSIANEKMHYKWSFATKAIYFRDGDSLDYINPRIVFDTAGVYPVKLVVSTDKGCLDSITHIIKLGHPHAHHTTNVDFGGDVYANPTVTFTDNSYDHGVTITDWQWNFGNGTNAAVQNPTPIHYTCGGNYNVNLRITDEIPCSVDTNSIVVIQIKPHAFFAISAPNYTPDVYARPTFTFTDHTTVNDGCPSLTYNWNFGDGYGSTSASPTHIFKGSGTYTVTQIVTNQNGGKKDTLSQNVTVAIKPKAGFTNSQSLVPDVYASPTVSFVNSTSSTDTAATPSALQYAWDFGDGTSSTSQNPASHVYTTGGNYSVKLLVTNLISGLQDQVSQLIIIKIKPKANFTIGAAVFSPDAYAQPSYTFTNTSTVNDASNSLTYNWDFGDGTAASTVTNPSHVYTASGTYTITLTVINTNGSLQNVVAKNLSVGIKPIADFTIGAAVLSPDVYAQPSYTFTNNNTTVVNDVNAVLTYSWNFGDFTALSTSPSPTHVYTKSGNYTVTLTVTNSNGLLMQDFITKNVTVAIKPKANFSTYANYNGDNYSNPTIEFTNTSTCTDGAASLSYVWNFGDASPTETGISPTHQYTTGGNKSVRLTVTNATSGLSDYIDIVVTVTIRPKAAISVNTISGTTTVEFWAAGAPAPAVNSSIVAGTITDYSWVFDVKDNGTGLITTAYATSNASNVSFNSATVSNYIITAHLTVVSDLSVSDNIIAVYEYGQPANNYTAFKATTPGRSNIASSIQLDKQVLRIYPNPSTNAVIIGFVAKSDMSIVKLIDMTGRIVKTVNVSTYTNKPISTRIDVMGLNAGIYQIVVLDKLGNRIVTSKLLKQ